MFSVDFAVDVCLVFCIFSSNVCRFLLYFLSIFCPYSARVIARVHRDQHKPAQCLRNRPRKSGPTYCIVPLIKRLAYCIMIEYNNLEPNMYSNLSCYDIFKTRPREFFGRYSVSRSSTFCWYLLGFLPVSCSYSVHIIARVHRNQHKSALRVRLCRPKSDPTYCIVPLIRRPIYCIMTQCNNLEPNMYSNL